jgi:carbon-monoxide dehydrogenase large subunit
VVNAIVDALRPYGVADVPMPCTPERVWRALRGGGPEHSARPGAGGGLGSAGGEA